MRANLLPFQLADTNYVVVVVVVGVHNRSKQIQPVPPTAQLLPVYPSSDCKQVLEYR